jgi:hypothetical protein
MTRPFAIVALALAVALVLAACGSQRREVASLVEAVDRYRRAEMDAKAPLASALAAVPCTEAEVCDAKTACVAAATPTVQGVALKAQVEASLAQLHAGKLTQDQAAALELPKKLDEASRLLEDGHAKLPTCHAKITALRLKFAL